MRAARAARLIFLIQPIRALSASVSKAPYYAHFRSSGFCQRKQSSLKKLNISSERKSNKHSKFEWESKLISTLFLILALESCVISLKCRCIKSYLTHPRAAETGLLAVLDPNISFVGTTRVIPLKSSTIPPNLAFSAKLCDCLGTMVLEGSLGEPLGLATGGAEGVRRYELLLVSNPDGRTPGTERAECDIARRLARIEMRNGWEMPTATR